MKRFLRGVGILVAVLAVIGVVFYAFGGPVQPTAAQRASYETLRAKSLAPAAERSGLVVPIPGCVCHSGDSVQIVQHAGYRLRECSRCH